MQINLLPWQKEVVNDDHRFRIINAGRRTGKSVLSRMIILQWATKQPGLYWIVSPTYKMSKQIHWLELQKEVPRDWIVKKNEVDLSIVLKNGAIIELKGAENVDSLRGVKLRGLVIDEIASIRNWNWLWQEVLRPTLTDYEAPAIFISTPKGFNHFYELFQLGINGEANYRSWHFTTYDNPTISVDEIESAKTELSEDAFHQEYLAEFRKFTGIVFKQWVRDKNIVAPFDIPSSWQYSRGFDYGSTHFTASVKIATDRDGNNFVSSCYMDNKRTIEEHAKVIAAQDFSQGIIPAWGDPSGAQWFMEFDKYGLAINTANKEVGQSGQGWVEYCIEKINEMLKPKMGHFIRLPNGIYIDDAPNLLILDIPENQPLIRQIENLKWRETIRGSGNTIPVLDESDDPTGGHYDLVAALRYWAVSFSPSNKADVQRIIEYNKQQRKKWGIGR